MVKNENALIIFAHGASDPEWAAPFESIKKRILLTRPDLYVQLAYLERMPPNIESAVEEAVRAGAKTIAIIPFFLARGGHLKRDLPPKLNSLCQTYKNITFHLCAPLGESKTMLDTMADWAIDCSGLNKAGIIRKES
ncbi:MAG: CbiX/SirB N-terminal domain-containing protein [Proteobacteria bacterium]|nr:CbiX/SirB N-terminal domain-containing protein [Pseudomonadota bacterium]MDE3207666.1 CbiX/SirB N-terminal domain-containing protein [Pseudomonadota bacterium]